MIMIKKGRLTLPPAANENAGQNNRLQKSIEDMQENVRKCVAKSKEFQANVKKLDHVMAKMERNMKKHQGNLGNISNSLAYQKDLSSRLVGIIDEH